AGQGELAAGEEGVGQHHHSGHRTEDPSRHPLLPFERRASAATPSPRRPVVDGPAPPEHSPACPSPGRQSPPPGPGGKTAPTAGRSGERSTDPSYCHIKS